MDETNDDLTAERDRLLGEVARLRVSKATGVPVGMLADADDEVSARALADQALAWQADQPPRPQATAAVSPYSRPGQISKPVLSHLDGPTTMALYRAGRLEDMGAPAPGPRQNGEHHA